MPTKVTVFNKNLRNRLYFWDVNFFYCTYIDNGIAFLSEEEAHHCARVLRKKTGDNLYLLDGKGGKYKGIIEEASKKKVSVRITEQLTSPATGTPNVHIAIGPTKNISRLEWFLEKATEIGVSTITPILCEHAERKVIKPERLNKILISAMKQSTQAVLPELRPMVKLKEFVAQNNGDNKFIAWVESDQQTALQHNYPIGKDVCIMIGPEGGFSPQEVEWAQQNDFKAVSLGSSRLRTETAGIVACHTIALLNHQPNK